MTDCKERYIALKREAAKLSVECPVAEYEVRERKKPSQTEHERNLELTRRYSKVFNFQTKVQRVVVKKFHDYAGFVETNAYEVCNGGKMYICMNRQGHIYATMYPKSSRDGKTVHSPDGIIRFVEIGDGWIEFISMQKILPNHVAIFFKDGTRHAFFHQ